MPLPSDTDASLASETEIPAADLAAQDTPVEQSTNGDPAAPPAADEKRTLLDVVKDAVKPQDTEDSSASEAEKPDPNAAPKEEPELTAEELAKVPFNRHPDFRRLVKERNTFKTKSSEFEGQIRDLEGPAQQFRNIDGYLKTNEITGEEFVGLMKLGALLKTNPAEARTELIKVLIGLDEITGERIPADLQADVDAGGITEERARELSRARATATAATHRAEAADAKRTSTLTEVEERDAAAKMEQAIDAWEAQKRKDPDFEAKDKLVADRVIALNSRLGKPKTPEEAVQRCQTAWDEVTKDLGAFLPKRQQTRRSPESGSTATVALAQPKNLQAALEASLAR